MPEIYQIVIVALFATFIILVATKIGLRDFIILRASELLSKMVSCDFCLGFWLSVFICAILFLFDVVSFTQFFILPILTAPIIRFLL